MRRVILPAFRGISEAFMTALVLGLTLLLQAGAGPGVVSGQLRTVEGAPAVAVRVIVVKAPSETSRPSFGPQYYDAEPPSSTSLTDQQGRFRLVNIPPGRYFLMSGATYFPSTIDADKATVLTIAAGSNM